MVLETKHVNQRQRDEFHPCSLLAVSAGPPGSGFLTWKTESDDDTRTRNCLMCVLKCVLKHFGNDGKAIQLFVSRLLECYP